MSSQDAIPNYHNYMYESILRTATDDDDFEFKVFNRPLPVTSNWRLRNTTAGYDLINMTMFFQKQYDYLNGLTLVTYWASSWLADVLKLEIILMCTFAFFDAFQMEYDDIGSIFLMFPLAFVSFVYAVSYLFKNPANGLMALVLFHTISMILGD
eukprot:CAMPEP_0116875144 /NCGR_PEP_ID=MMETSP0463-20121206/6928_1 /TAXON_ID=181622 /ORGANISM="Strombidinopsis sp, Strain SopsisLIS2011" /LENGTH=153 /DNA_ID=CAMNT_0004520139 /DNA_START=21 /DNA_END=482 /DNA_ORIENTATION=+